MRRTTMYLIAFIVSMIALLGLFANGLLGPDPDRTVPKAQWIAMGICLALASVCGVLMFLGGP